MKAHIWIVGLMACLLPIAAWAQPTNNTGGTDKKNIDPDRVIIKRERKAIDTMYMNAYMERVKKAELDGIYIPKDLFDAFKELDKLMDEEAREQFMAFADEEVDKQTHGTLGLWIKLKWSLIDGSRLSYYFTKMGVPHYEYMVGIIIQSYHRNLHKRDLKIKEQVEHFRKLWNEKQKKEAEELLKEHNSKQ